MFISEAYAQAGGEPGTGDFLISLLPLILIFVVFYFLLIRPQQKRMKDHRDMLTALRRGDRVVTGGGIIGQVIKVADDECTVEIGEGMRVRVLRSTIQSVLSKPQPRDGKESKEGKGRGRRRTERLEAQDNSGPEREADVGPEDSDGKAEDRR